MTSIIFMGTPQFAATILAGLLQDSNYQIVAVVTQPDKYVGRKKVLTASPVKQLALAHQLPLYQPAKLPKSPELKQLIALEADLIVTAAYGQFLPTSLLKSVKIAAVNVHGSLLPKYRGGAPIQYAILQGESKTGITLINMTKKMDAGSMLGQVELPIQSTDDAGSLFEKLSLLGRDLLLEKLPAIIAGKLVAVPQDERQVSFAPIITSKQERLQLTATAQQLDQKVRALRPEPGAYFADFGGKRTKLWAIEPLSEQTELPAGYVVDLTKHTLKLSAAQGTVYQVKELQPAGKARQKISDYLNGQGKQITVNQRLIKE
ncbi:MAG: methionyl-tRNA formyltransferase [Liquorilactobacillus ghanensis]|uniref:methionyl-tRNA formyltransferase n=1 Tax=Liquorilactobacillus ghanensis TaxID=399370 RepID=UPI0039EC6914